MTPKRFLDSVLRPLEVTSTTLNQAQLDAAADATNASYQEVWASNMTEAWRKGTHSFSTVDGTQTYVLPASVNSVQSYGVVDGYPMTRLANEGMLVFFADRCEGSTTGKPRRYFVKSDQAATTEADASVISIMLQPVPDAVYSVVLDVELAAPRYDGCDLLIDSGAMTCPDAAIEAYLIPLVSYRLTQSPLFNRPDAAPGLKEASDRALFLLLSLIHI